MQQALVFQMRLKQFKFALSKQQYTFHEHYSQMQKTYSSLMILQARTSLPTLSATTSALHIGQLGLLLMQLLRQSQQNVCLYQNCTTHRTILLAQRTPPYKSSILRLLRWMTIQRTFFRTYPLSPFPSNILLLIIVNLYQIHSELIALTHLLQFISYYQIMGNCQSNQIIQDTYVPVLGKLGAVLDLKIVNCVWQKDYQGLFDYQSKDIKQYTYHVKARSLIMYDKQRKIVKQINEVQLNQQTLKSAAFEVIRKSNYYKIEPIFLESEQYTIQKLVWLIVKSVPHHRYPLKEKDIIKFGKQKIKVREIVLNDPNQHHSDLHSIKTNKKVYDDLKLKPTQDVPHNITSKDDLIQQIQSVATENQQTCRICLQPGQHTNPLICACKCLGSVRYIHLNCLRTWLGKRLNVSKSKFSVVIKWTPLTCQVCKKHYKYRIYLDNKKYYTVDIPKPNKPYIVLQVMKKSTQYSKIFHFVSLSQTSKVSIGRRKDIDIKISDDVSVSRHHANLIYDFEGKKFLLQDNKSKFGTLVLVSKNLLINPFQRGISFQMGGEVFIFDTQRGQGSIPDYYDEVQYLNVAQKGEKAVAEDQESDENNGDQDMQNDQEDQQEESLPTNLNLNNIASHNASQINISPLIIQTNQINNPQIIANYTNPTVLNNNPHIQQAQILDA